MSTTERDLLDRLERNRRTEEEQEERLRATTRRADEHRRRPMVGGADWMGVPLPGGADLRTRRRRTGRNHLADVLMAGSATLGSLSTSLLAGGAFGLRKVLEGVDKIDPQDYSVQVERMRNAQDWLAGRSSELIDIAARTEPFTGVVTRLGAEGLAVATGAKALTSVGMAPRAAAILGGVPNALLQSAGGPEASSVSGLASLTLGPDSPTAQAIAESMEDTGTRVAAEVALDVGLGGLMEAITPLVRGVRSADELAAGRPAPTGGVETAPPKQPDTPPVRDPEAGPPRDPETVTERQIEQIDEQLGGLELQAPDDPAVENLVRGGMSRDEAVRTVEAGRGQPPEPTPVERGMVEAEEVAPRVRRVGDPIQDDPSFFPERPRQVRGEPRAGDHGINFDKEGWSPEAAFRFEELYHQMRGTGDIPPPVVKTNAAVRQAANMMGIDELESAVLNRSINEVTLDALAANFDENLVNLKNGARRMSEIEVELGGQDLTPEKLTQLRDEWDLIDRRMVDLDHQQEFFAASLVEGGSQAGRMLQILKSAQRGGLGPMYMLNKLRKVKMLTSGDVTGRGFRGRSDIGLLNSRRTLPELDDLERAQFNEAYRAMKDDQNFKPMEDLFDSYTPEMTAAQKLSTYRRAFLLSGFRTAGRNAVSNALETGVAELVDQPLASLVDQLIAPYVNPVREMPRVRGPRGEIIIDPPAGTPFRATEGSVWTSNDRLKAGTAGAKKGWVEAGRVILRKEGATMGKGLEAGKLGESIARKWDDAMHGRARWGGGDIPFVSAASRRIGSMSKWLFDLQNFYDAPNRYGAWAGSVDDMAGVMTRHLPEGQRAAAKQALVDAPTVDMVDIAVIESLERVFQNETSINDIARTVNNRFNEMAQSPNTAARWFGGFFRFGFAQIAPYRKTPSSLAVRAMFERAPGVSLLNIAIKKVDLANAGHAAADALLKNGDLTSRQWAELTLLQRQFNTAVARSVSGHGITIGLYKGLMMTGGYLAAQGLITGAYPSDPETQREWRQQNKIPFAMRFGDTWVGLANILPYGGLFGYGAQLYLDSQEESVGSAIQQAPGDQLTQFQDQSFMQGWNDLSEAITEGGTYWERLFASQAGSYVPTMAADIAQWYDPVLRSTRSDTPLQAAGRGVLKRVPGASTLLPANTDVLGRERTVPPASLLSPVNLRQIPQDLVLGTLTRLNITMPETTKQGSESEAQFAARKEVQGRGLERAIAELVTNSTFLRLPRDRQQIALSQLTGQVRSYMNENDQQQTRWSPYVRRAIESARRR